MSMGSGSLNFPKKKTCLKLVRKLLFREAYSNYNKQERSNKTKIRLFVCLLAIMFQIVRLL